MLHINAYMFTEYVINAVFNSSINKATKKIMKNPSTFAGIKGIKSGYLAPFNANNEIIEISAINPEK